MNAKRTIILARHGDASWVPRDYDRPLSARGRSDIANGAIFLIKKGLQPHKIVYSPSRRTRESLEIVRRVCGRATLVSDVEFEPLYQCTVVHLLDACCFGDGIQNLMVLAHNPGLEDFLDYAVEDGASVFKQYGGVMPGTMAVLEAVYDGNMLSSRKGKVLDWFSP